MTVEDFYVLEAGCNPGPMEVEQLSQLHVWRKGPGASELSGVGGRDWMSCHSEIWGFRRLSISHSFAYTTNEWEYQEFHRPHMFHVTAENHVVTDNPAS